jgi:DNA (cytosine-5)-methyltransferase 1
MPASFSDLTYPELLHAAWQLHQRPRAANAPTVISTFAGGGGSGLGYSFAGFRELLAVEFDAHAAATLRANFPALDVYEGDIAQLSVNAVLKRTGLKRGELTIFDGSPPCQGFSLIGKRSFDDARNQLFREYVRLLDGLQPKGFVLENVPGLAIGKMRLIFADMLKALRAAGRGYHVRAWILNAQDYGVPQGRRRLVVLGVRSDLPAAQLSHPPFRVGRPRLVQHAVAGLQDEPWQTLSPSARRIWKHAGMGQSGADLGLTWEHAKPTSYFGTVKVNPYRPSPTLTKSGARLFLHWREPRSLSIGEAKRIGSFPDAFTLDGAFGAQWGRIGNSVPPVFMWAVASHMREVLGV